MILQYLAENYLLYFFTKAKKNLPGLIFLFSLLCLHPLSHSITPLPPLTPLPPELYTDHYTRTVFTEVFAEVSGISLRLSEAFVDLQIF